MFRILTFHYTTSSGRWLDFFGFVESAITHHSYYLFNTSNSLTAFVGVSDKITEKYR